MIFGKGAKKYGTNRKERGYVMKQITNETGIFYIDDSGVLLRYESAAKNFDDHDKGPRNIVHLTIPEGGSGNPG